MKSSRPTGEFLHAVVSFPAVLFGFSLLVVLAYWAVVLFAGIDLGGDAGADPSADVGTDSRPGGRIGAVAALGLAGAPIGIALSILIALSWFGSLVGTVLLDRVDPSSVVRFGLSVAVLVAALAAATWSGADASSAPAG